MSTANLFHSSFRKDSFTLLTRKILKSHLKIHSFDPILAGFVSIKLREQFDSSKFQIELSKVEEAFSLLKKSSSLFSNLPSVSDESILLEWLNQSYGQKGHRKAVFTWFNLKKGL